MKRAFLERVQNKAFERTFERTFVERFGQLTPFWLRVWEESLPCDRDLVSSQVGMLLKDCGNINSTNETIPEKVSKKTVNETRCSTTKLNNYVSKKELKFRWFPETVYHSIQVPQSPVASATSRGVSKHLKKRERKEKTHYLVMFCFTLHFHWWTNYQGPSQKFLGLHDREQKAINRLNAICLLRKVPFSKQVKIFGHTTFKWK